MVGKVSGWDTRQCEHNTEKSTLQTQWQRHSWLKRKVHVNTPEICLNAALIHQSPGYGRSQPALLSWAGRENTVLWLLKEREIKISVLLWAAPWQPPWAPLYGCTVLLVQVGHAPTLAMATPGTHLIYRVPLPVVLGRWPAMGPLGTHLALMMSASKDDLKGVCSHHHHWSPAQWGQGNQWSCLAALDPKSRYFTLLKRFLVLLMSLQWGGWQP